MRMLVIGRGFVGSAVVASARRHGHEVYTMAAPRLRTGARDVQALVEDAELIRGDDDIAEAIERAEVVINCAGLAKPASALTDELVGANSLLPIVLAMMAARCVRETRFLHVSSAAVQGEGVLDESRCVRPWSAYSQTKAWAEQGVVQAGARVTVYRPASVHGPDRHLTASLARFARSPWASVAGDGRALSPVAHVDNVADGIVFVAESQRAPAIVLHPSDGLTCREVLSCLGGREPWHLPAPAVHGVLRVLGALGRYLPKFAALRRRVEVTWCGQAERAGWLAKAGWTPALSSDEWRAMGERMEALRCE